MVATTMKIILYFLNTSTRDKFNIENNLICFFNITNIGSENIMTSSDVLIPHDM